MAATVAKLLAEASVLRHLKDAELTPLRRSALLLVGPLGAVSKARVAAAVFGRVARAGGAAADRRPDGGRVIATVGFLALIGGELAERFEFFAA